MKIAIQMDDEKLTAVRMYLTQKGTSLEAELTRHAEQLYQKNVPQNVKDFITMSSRRTARRAKPEPKNP